MAIKKWIITGDTHGKVALRLDNIACNIDIGNPGETAVIILGDAGFNFWLNDSDVKTKKQAAKYGLPIYCVRGNHEERPELIDTMKEIYDPEVKGYVYQEDTFPLIKYFKDGGIYDINGHSTLVIGGAYSVDKHYRLRHAAILGQSFSGWFENEELSYEEMDKIKDNIKGKNFDFILSHTCPLDWEPTDLFLPSIDQSKVSKQMEEWLNKIKETINWRVYCFGHYHADRMEQPNVFQFYTNYEDLSDIWLMGTEKYNDYKTMYPKGPRYKEEG